MSKKSPWSSDAAVGATMQDYEIRTVADFLKVPEERRYVCLREFHSWLHMQQAVVDLLVACGAQPEQVRMRNPDLFTWKDDGEATISVTLHEAGTADAVATPADEGKAVPSREETGGAYQDRVTPEGQRR
jgi:hypothetical protein